MEKLTIQEEQAMVVVWQLGACTVKEIQARYPEPQPPYTTLASVVKNLEGKGYIKGTHAGKTYTYEPLISQSEYKRQRMTGFVRDYFSDSFKEMVTFFARDQKLTPDDLKEIITLIEEGTPSSPAQ